MAWALVPVLLSHRVPVLEDGRPGGGPALPLPSVVRRGWEGPAAHRHSRYPAWATGDPLERRGIQLMYTEPPCGCGFSCARGGSSHPVPASGTGLPLLLPSPPFARRRPGGPQSLGCPLKDRNWLWRFLTASPPKSPKWPGRSPAPRPAPASFQSRRGNAGHDHEVAPGPRLRLPNPDPSGPHFSASQAPAAALPPPCVPGQGPGSQGAVR